MGRGRSTGTFAAAVGAAALVTLGTGAACKESSEAGATGRAEGGHAAGSSAVAGFGGGEPADASALALLPSDALFAIAVDDPAGLASELGREPIVDDAGEPYERMREAVVELTGHNLLTPDGLREIGLDPGAPAGAFFLDAQSWTGGFFATLREPETFEGFLRGFAKDAPALSWKVEEVGDGRLHVPEGEGDEAALLLRDGHVMLIVSESFRADEGATAAEVARKLAKRTKGEGLTAEPAFEKARDELGFGSRVAGYGNVDAGLAALRRSIEQDEGGSSYREHLEKKLDEAREADDEEAIERWESRIERHDRRQKRMRERQQKVLELADEALGAVPGVAFGLEIDGAAVRAKARIPFDEEAPLLARVFEPTEEPPAVARALRDEPLAVASLHLDREELVSVVEQMAADFGAETQLEAMKSRVTEAYGIDVDADVLEGLTGELAYYVDGDPSELLEGDKPLASLEGGLVVGLTEGAEFDALVSKLASETGLSELLERTGDDGPWKADLPRGRSVHVRIGGGYLTASTEEDFHERVVSGAGDGGLLAERDGGYAALLGVGGTSVVSTLHQALPAAWLMMMAPPSAMKEPGERDRDDEPDDPAYERKKAELEEVEEKLDELRRERHEDEREMMRLVLERLGQSGLALRPEDGGLTVYAGQFMEAESVRAAVTELASKAFALERRGRERSRKRGELFDRKRELREELARMRREHSADGDDDAGQGR